MFNKRVINMEDVDEPIENKQACQTSDDKLIENNQTCQTCQTCKYELIEIKQTWWHIEEIYFPSNARIIRQVMDIFTNQNAIYLYLNDKFVGLRVSARNSNREIAFLESPENNIVINIDPLNTFPKLPNDNIDNCKNCNHVKLEIEYILIDPKIEKYNLSFKFNPKFLLEIVITKILHKKKATIKILGRIQPEIYITFPEGWRIANNGSAIGMNCFIDNKKETNIELSNSNNKPIRVQFHEPFVKLIDRKYKYNYLITEDSYNNICSKIKKDSSVYFEFTYISQMSRMFAYILFVIPSVFLIISSIILYCGYNSIIQKIPFPFETSITTGYLILLLSFLYFYYGIVKENFFIPYKRVHSAIFIYTLLVILAIFFKNVPFVQDIIQILF